MVIYQLSHSRCHRYFLSLITAASGDTDELSPVSVSPDRVATCGCGCTMHSPFGVIIPSRYSIQHPKVPLCPYRLELLHAYLSYRKCPGTLEYKVHIVWRIQGTAGSTVTLNLTEFKWSLPNQSLKVRRQLNASMIVTGVYTDVYVTLCYLRRCLCYSMLSTPMSMLLYAIYADVYVTLCYLYLCIGERRAELQ